MIEIGIIAGSLLAAISIVFHTLRSGIPPMPSSPRARRKLLELIPDPPRGVIFELGSGWGTLAVALARRFPHTRVCACEISPIPYLFSKLLQRILALPNLEIRRADLMQIPLEQAAAVLCYLSPALMPRLAAKLVRELRPGTAVLSQAFAIPSWKAEVSARIGGVWTTPVYRYRVPACSPDEIPH